MHYLYVDEAGTSAREHVSVVAGLLIHADSQWRRVEREINYLLDQYVPPPLRRGYIFHAKQLFSGGKHREEWEEGSRLKLLLEMAAIPRRFGVPIAYGMTRRDGLPKELYAKVAETRFKLKPNEFDHLMAFQFCIASADDFLRKFTTEDEVATLVLEDVSNMRAILRLAPDMLRKNPRHYRVEMLRNDVSDLRPERILTGVDFKVSQFVDCAHYAGKTEAPLLQVADACAFAARRWINKESRGQELIDMMLGPLSVAIDDYSGLTSLGIWHPAGLDPGLHRPQARV